MQGVRRYQFLSEGGVRLELTPTSNSPLAIDVAESTEMRIQRLIAENPVVIFSRPSCCMCHVMKRLLSSIGVHPTVIELDDDEISALDSTTTATDNSPPVSPVFVDPDSAGASPAPAVFIGGTRVGGLESLVGLHLSGHLVPKLVEVGALRGMML